MDTTSATKDTVVQINMTGGSGKTNCPPLVPAIIIITTTVNKIIISNITKRTRMTRVPPSLGLVATLPCYVLHFFYCLHPEPILRLRYNLHITHTKPEV